jgi:glucose/arabinose dehydrogenase
MILMLSASLLVSSDLPAAIGQGQELSQLVQQPLTQQGTGITQHGSNNTGNIAPALPQLNNSKLKVEMVTEGLRFPTAMAFIDNRSDMLITEKGGGVLLFSAENKTKVPLMNFTVNEQSERGLLGLAILNLSSSDLDPASITLENSNETLHMAKNGTATNASKISPYSITTNKTFAFFYVTETSKPNATGVLGNRIYRFEWNDAEKSFSNGTLIMDLPATPGPNHNGGKLIVDSNNGYLYAVIGDLNRNGLLQNFKNGSLPDDTSVILRLNPDGSAVRENPFQAINRTDSRYANLTKYYAYGIRNSFGLAIDPITGALWDTENGPSRFDEINRVRPGFNSGWEKVIGPIARRNVTVEKDLVNYFGSSSYADPVFSWARTVGVTDIEFYKSNKLGMNYTNNIFVGDFNNGRLYYFELNGNRSGLKFEHPQIADDLVASNDRQVASVIFGTGFIGGITDISTGPDGFLYILTYSGRLYRIVN